MLKYSGYASGTKKSPSTPIGVGYEGTAELTPERDSDESRTDAQSGNIGSGNTEQGDLQLNIFGQPFGDAYDDKAENKWDKLFSASAVITEEKVNAVLRQCGNTDKARMMVVAEFSKDKPIEDKVEYLKKIYHGGYGLLEDGTKMCAFFDDEGMHINGGTRALAPGSKLFSWEQVAEKIDKMPDKGTYTNLQELKDAPFLERQQLAESVWYFQLTLLKYVLSILNEQIVLKLSIYRSRAFLYPSSSQQS